VSLFSILEKVLKSPPPRFQRDALFLCGLGPWKSAEADDQKIAPEQGQKVMTHLGDISINETQ
jgi:hypothetical protein